jgi:hypothetical protein
MKKVFFVLLPLLACFACGKDTATNATFELRLTDGPGSFEAVLIDVIGAEVHVNKTPQAAVVGSL